MITTPSPSATAETGPEVERTLAELFPFLVVTDAALCVRGLGRLTHKLFPELSLGAALQDFFELGGLADATGRLAPVGTRPGRSTILRRRQAPPIVMKGQWHRHDESRLFFLGWPLVRSAEDLHRLGIRNIDIPPHNHLSDLLLVLRSSEMTLADAAELTRRASERARELERLNERLRGESELVRARQAAEAASDAKSRFLSHFSHELRTPMNAILGYAEMLVDGYYGDMPQTAVTVLERMQINGRHLLELINKILDLSVIEAGQMTLSVRAFDLRATCDSIVAATLGLAAQKGLEYSATIHPDLGTIEGDELRVTQVLINLIGNAIKFTSAGAVQFAAWPGEDDVTLEVRDTGPGIAPEDQERIFKAFQQVKLPGGVTVGAGLGLAIASKIIALHGGTIEVRSTLGQGSVFRVRLPRRAVAGEAQ